MADHSRMNLKELRDLLNKLPEKDLDKYAITNDLSFEDPEGKISICFLILDEGDEGNLLPFYDLPEYELLENRLLRHLNDDVRKCVMFKMGTYDNELELEDIEPDWESEDK